MRFCYECGRITAGDPLFCNFCGRSYNVKLCPRHHPNPRIADVCSQCGSRDLSTPQPRVSVWWRIFAFVLKVSLGGLLIYVSIEVLSEFLIEVLSEPYVQNGLIAISLLVAALWFLWSLLPAWIRKAIHHALETKKDNHGGH